VLRRQISDTNHSIFVCGWRWHITHWSVARRWVWRIVSCTCRSQSTPALRDVYRPYTNTCANSRRQSGRHRYNNLNRKCTAGYTSTAISWHSAPCRPIHSRLCQPNVWSYRVPIVGHNTSSETDWLVGDTATITEFEDDDFDDEMMMMMMMIIIIIIIIQLNVTQHLTIMFIHSHHKLSLILWDL